jgi:hypothetical protein
MESEDSILIRLKDFEILIISSDEMSNSGELLNLVHFQRIYRWATVRRAEFHLGQASSLME